MQKGVTYVNDVMDGPYDEYDNGKLEVPLCDGEWFAGRTRDPV